MTPTTATPLRLSAERMLAGAAAIALAVFAALVNLPVREDPIRRAVSAAA